MWMFPIDGLGCRGLSVWGMAGMALAMMVSPAFAADCVMSVRMDEDPPYLTRLSDGSPGGVNAEVTREALRRMGCRTEFRALPFSRSLKELQEGGLDVVADLFATPERESYALFSQTRNQVPNRLFIRAADAGRWDIRAFSDLPRLGIKLGVETGSLVGPDFGKASDDPQFRAIVTPVRSHDSLWRMLQAGRLDAVIMDEQTARWELAHLGRDGSIVGTGFVAAAAPAFFAFSRARVTPDQVRHFDQAVEAMRKDGTLSAILSNYGLGGAALIDVSGD